MISEPRVATGPGGPRPARADAGPEAGLPGRRRGDRLVGVAAQIRAGVAR